MKQVYIIAGPNGSGKTTFAKELLIEQPQLIFLNADEIALKIAGNTNVHKVRLRAGKEFFRQFEEVVLSGAGFVLETTLSGKYLEQLICRLQSNSYEITLIYIFVENINEAINRIRLRVAKGGHNVPDEDIRRRFGRSVVNFWTVYRQLVDQWKLFFNGEESFLPVAMGEKIDYNIINDEAFELFQLVLKNYDGKENR